MGKGREGRTHFFRGKERVPHYFTKIHVKRMLTVSCAYLLEHHSVNNFGNFILTIVSVDDKITNLYFTTIFNVLYTRAHLQL